MGFNDYKRFLNSTVGCGKTTAMCEAIVNYQKKNPDKMCTIVICEPQSLNKYNLTKVLERLDANLNRIEFVTMSDIIKRNRKYVDFKDLQCVTKPLSVPTYITHECYDLIIRELLNTLETVQGFKQFKDVKEWKEM